MHFETADADAALDLGGLGGDLSRRQDNTVGDCNVTGQYCCDSLVSHSSASASALTGLLSLPTSLLPDQDSYMGLGCSPIASLLESGGQCSTNQVCCKGSQKMENGLINVGCSSVSA
ncbi:hypothetical protein CALVIDRAFT_542191 [Calocera viscosa TUFC12733]|uniref:Hydrophobin n=1 Tax=Calocera viscosa (strain TUFC12733) TaxID=1330018 RepID=A0A167GY75_CALVF|nr:hypothetical protein CALVIDRAFT_542191 [Calocera viscosa TUFC12733]